VPSAQPVFIRLHYFTGREIIAKKNFHGLSGKAYKDLDSTVVIVIFTDSTIIIIIFQKFTMVAE